MADHADFFSFFPLLEAGSYFGTEQYNQDYFNSSILQKAFFYEIICNLIMTPSSLHMAQENTFKVLLQVASGLTLRPLA